MLWLTYSFLDTARGNTYPEYLPGYRFLYQSPSIGLDNVWSLWLRSDSTAVILLRGTTADARSWLADFYCAMIPAQGMLILPHDDTVSYRLARDPRAAVHAGFLLGFAYLSRDIGPKIDSLYRAGYHHYLVAGHSQGGALCYFVSAWLWNAVSSGQYPLMEIKTYASASPKVGNMYFAYDYNNLTRSQWSFSLVNSYDVVPEMPFTTQQLETDMNQPNPFLNLNLKKMPFLQRIFIKRAVNQMRKKAAKSSKTYQKYLSGYTSNIAAKMFPGIQFPEAVNSTYFVRPGVPISLMPDSSYFRHFEAIKDGPYYHHGMDTYRFLLRESYPGYYTPCDSCKF